MRPVRDPIRSLIYAAADRAVKTVIVDGKTVVEGGRVLTMDHEKAAAELEAAQRGPSPRWQGSTGPPRSPDHLALVYAVKPAAGRARRRRQVSGPLEATWAAPA